MFSEHNNEYDEFDEYLYEPMSSWLFITYNIVSFLCLLIVCASLDEPFKIIRLYAFGSAGILFFDYFVLKVYQKDYQIYLRYKDAVLQGSRRYYALYKLRQKYRLDDIDFIDHLNKDFGRINTFEVFNYASYLKQNLMVDSLYQQYLDFDRRYQLYRSELKCLSGFTTKDEFEKRFPDSKLDYKVFQEYERKFCKYCMLNTHKEYGCLVTFTYSDSWFTQITEGQVFGYDDVISICKSIDAGMFYEHNICRVIFGNPVLKCG